MELKKFIEDANNDMAEIKKLAEHIEQKQSLLLKYGIEVEFKAI